MYTFKKNERITSLKEVDSLFERGKSSAVGTFPVRAVFQTYPLPQTTPATPLIKILVSVAKKRLHHAVDRNRAKRQIREAYRLQHTKLTETLTTINTTADNPIALRIAFIWISDKPQTIIRVSESVLKALTLIQHKISQRHTPDNQ